MTVIKRSFLRNWNLVIAWFLSLFGVACSPFSAEYGTPQGKFLINGTVKSEETNGSIDHIRVIMGKDTTFTNSSGKYEVSMMDFPTSQSFDLSFTDVDGSANGEFLPKDTLIQFDNPQFRDGDKHWYAGETEKEVNISLKAKK